MCDKMRELESKESKAATLLIRNALNSIHFIDDAPYQRVSWTKENYIHPAIEAFDKGCDPPHKIHFELHSFYRRRAISTERVDYFSS